ncbi:signal peptide peptidase SppA [Thermoproteota archaeon]
MNSLIYAEDLLYDTLKSGMGVRALSMGGAYTALAEDGPALHYNPAGLSKPGGSYRYEYLDYKTTNYDEFGVHFVYASPFGLSNFHKYNKTGDTVDGTTFGFGYRGRKAIDWGLNYKTMQYKTAAKDYNGWSTDLGLLLHVMPGFDLGVTGHDIFKHNLPIPATVTTGFALSLFERTFILCGDVDYERINDNSHFITRFGVEYNITEGLTFRAGVFKDRLTGGAGLSLPFVKVDYGMIMPTDGKGTQYLLSFTFGKGVIPPKPYQDRSIFKPKTFAEIQIDKDLVEGKSNYSLFDGAKMGTNDLLRMIHTAGNEPSCAGFLLKIGPVSASLSSVGLMQELRAELLKSKKKGKHIIAYIENWASLPEYYLASAADTIIIPELGTISHLGLELEIVKTKTFLNNFGIGTHVISSGAYKGILTPTSEELTEMDRAVLEDLIHDLYHQVLFDIKENRALIWAQVSQVFDGRLISASDALEKGLVDRLGYWSDAQDLAKGNTSSTGNASEDMPPAANVLHKRDIVPITAYDPPSLRPSLFGPFNLIAVIEIDGVIQENQKKSIFFTSKDTGADEIDEIAELLKDDYRIKGVILRINSPGGSLLASDRIYSAVEKLRKSGKTVYASMGNLAASGGYYVAMNADRIIANPGTLTGSIGVISFLQDYEKLHQILGIKTEIIKTGRYMDLFSSTKGLSDEELDLLNDFQAQKHQIFIQKLRESRNLSQEEAQDVAQGQILTGSQAKKLHLVDELGNFYDTVDLLAKSVNIQDPEIVFIRPKSSDLVTLFKQGILAR